MYSVTPLCNPLSMILPFQVQVTDCDVKRLANALNMRVVEDKLSSTSLYGKTIRGHHIVITIDKRDTVVSFNAFNKSIEQ